MGLKIWKYCKNSHNVLGAVRMRCTMGQIFELFFVYTFDPYGLPSIVHNKSSMLLVYTVCKQLLMIFVGKWTLIVVGTCVLCICVIYKYSINDSVAFW